MTGRPSGRRAAIGLGLGVAVAAAAALPGGCGASTAQHFPDAAPGNPDATTNVDAPPGCTTFVDFEPAHPVADPAGVVVATGHVNNGQTFPTYTWIVKDPSGATVATTELGALGGVDTVQFAATAAGVYNVHFQAGDAATCQATDQPLQVDAPGARTQTYRLLVRPPAGAGAPPQERPVTISGGSDNQYGPLTLDVGLAVAGTVVDAGGQPVAAYLRFQPQAAPDIAIEAFSGVDGAFAALTQLGRHDVLIVPSSGALAPALIAGWQPQATAQLQLPAADTIAGTLLGPGGAPLAGAKVSLVSAGAPTTIATTDAAGAWRVLGHVGGAVDVVVVPPDGSGLPRLDVAAATLDLTQPVAIRYASGLATADLHGLALTSGGAAAAGAQVTFTGAIASAGTVTTGTHVAAAAGAIHVVAAADAGGHLGAAVVPAVPLTAVVSPAPAVFALIGLDASAPPAAIAVPAATTVSGTVTDPTGAPRAGARVRLAPIGALADATMLTPAVTSGPDGTFALQVAPGGHYALAIVDGPARYAGLDRADVTAGPQGALALGAAVALDGNLVVPGTSGGPSGAVMSLLCASCAGVARSRVLGEAISTGGGDFHLAVPDPGVALR